MEGKWTFKERLNNDGTHDYFNDTYQFGGGEADGSNYLSLQISGSENTIGDYLVMEKGIKMIFRKDINQPNTADTTTIEDWDKNTLIVRNVFGVLYFSKNGRIIHQF